jgi:glycosyltransferase involved in cell wall biosynthesis
MTPSVLCVHPHAELYGSDRTFLQSVRAIQQRWPEAKITVLLTAGGPLHDAIREIVDDVRIGDIFVLRRSDLGLKLVARLPRLLRAVFRARQLMVGYDVVYLNTVVLLDFMLASRLRRRPVLVHVHELPSGLTGKVFSALLRIANGALIYISDATRRGYNWLEAKPGVVIWNGTKPKRPLPRDGLSPGLNLLLIGRFNAWKGQPLLLDALARLTPEERARVSVRLVGSTFVGQDHFREAIETKVAALRLDDVVAMHDFDPDPDHHYAWADVVAVPSTDPEPFGLVAIEAMAAGRAVIAAGHGGLAEIVVAEQTGTLFAPRDAAALCSAIRDYLADPDLARVQGKAALARFAEQFDERIYMRRIADVAQAVADDRPVSQAALNEPATA